MPERRAWLPWLALLVIYLVWGSTYLAIRVVVREAPPLASGALRFLVAGTVMAVAAWRWGGPRAWPTARQARQYAVIGVLLLAVGNGLVMWAEKTVPSGIAALIVATVPLWITLLDGLRPRGEPWTLRVWLGVALGLWGVALVARPGGASGWAWSGVLALQMASLSWTVGSLYPSPCRRSCPCSAPRRSRCWPARRCWSRSRCCGARTGPGWPRSRSRPGAPWAT